jgi:hypothetical protein
VSSASICVRVRIRLLVGGFETLGDDLCERGADHATAEEEQAADPVDHRVAREDEPGVGGGQRDGEAEPESQQQIAGERIEPARLHRVIADLDAGQHGRGDQRGVLGCTGGAQAVVADEWRGDVEKDDARHRASGFGRRRAFGHRGHPRQGLL